MSIFGDLKDLVIKKDAKFYNDTLYPLQDKILQTIFSKPTEFYLTGGTALNRYILNNERFSDDLDLFLNRGNTTQDLDYFHERKEEILKSIGSNYDYRAEKEIFSDYKIISDSSFIYYVYDKSNTKLKLQFVLDHRPKTSLAVNTINGIAIDNTLNITTNKIATLWHRDSLKDFVDLYHIAKSSEVPIDWNNIVTLSNPKVAGITLEKFRAKCQEKLKHYQSSKMDELLDAIILPYDKKENEAILKDIFDNFTKTLFRNGSNTQSQNAPKKTVLHKLHRNT